MRPALFLGTKLAPQFRIRAHMVLASHLLRLSIPEMEKAIAKALADNPALECQIPRRSRSTPGISGMSIDRQRSERRTDNEDGDYDPVENVPSCQSALDQLVDQARLMVPAGEMEIVTQLIHLLDEHGFLRFSDAELSSDLRVPLERIRQDIHWLHRLDPPGIGAHDLRECFLLQCADLEDRGVDCAMLRHILEEAWDLFVQQRWDATAKRIGCSRSYIDTTVRFMHDNLYPFPLRLIRDTKDSLTIAQPDLIVRRLIVGGKPVLTVQVPAAEEYELRISRGFEMAVRSGIESGLASADREWICQSIARARSFIDALEQRWATLLWLGEFIVAYQHDFFELGPRHLIPMTRAEVAWHLGVHESTISRAVSDKILELPTGRLIELSQLFDRSLPAKEAIRELVDRGELINDREIAARLRRESFALSRRTIAKYRVQLGIPKVGHRKRMSPVHGRQ